MNTLVNLCLIHLCETNGIDILNQAEEELMLNVDCLRQKIHVKNLYNLIDNMEINSENLNKLILDPLFVTMLSEYFGFNNFKLPSFNPDKYTRNRYVWSISTELNVREHVQFLFKIIISGYLSLSLRFPENDIGISKIEVFLDTKYRVIDTTVYFQST